MRVTLVCVLSLLKTIHLSFWFVLLSTLTLGGALYSTIGLVHLKPFSEPLLTFDPEAGSFELDLNWD